jgi:Putative adhesin
MASWTLTQPQQLGFDEEVRRLDVSLIAGRLNVVGTDGPARLEVSRLGEQPLSVTLDGDVLSVRHPYPKTWPGILQPLWWWLNGGRRFHSDVSIAVPYTTPSVLRVSSGSVVASGVHADLTVDCVSGRITLLGNDGRIRAKVVSGPIEALGCAGDVTLETVSGEITLADSATERVHAKTISGPVTADLDNPPRHSDIFLETVSGEITVRVREDSDLSVHLSATGGRVTSAFPSLGGEADWSKAGGRWSKSLRGAIGAGTGRLNVRAISGNISLLCRPVDDDFGETR